MVSPIRFGYERTDQLLCYSIRPGLQGQAYNRNQYNRSCISSKEACMQRILVLGAGFAGLWAAVGAARRLAQQDAETIEVMVVDARAFHSIRVRNYETDLQATRVPLAEVLDPIGVTRLQGRIQHIDVSDHSVQVETTAGQQTLNYSRLVFALGSTLAWPPISGLAEHALDVDSYEGAMRLQTHLL